MILFRAACCAVVVFAVTASSVRADDMCLAEDEEKAAKTTIAAMSKAEKSGQPAELFVAYRSIADDDCIDRFDKNAQARAKANVSKLGRELAKAAEAKSFLYSLSRYGPMGGRRRSDILKPSVTSTRPTGLC